MELRSRRKLLQTGVAAALLAASGVPVLARVREGRLRIGLSDFVPDASFGASAGPSIYGAVAGQGAVYDTLTELSAEGALRGELAQNWHPSDNARVWTFTLRDGVRFHDGVPLDAHVVVDAFTRHCKTANPASVLAMVTDIQALSARELRFTLQGSNPDFPWYLSDPALVVTRPAPVAGDPPVGTGLYRFAAGPKDGRVLAKRVPQHYKDGHAGWFEEVELVFLPDESDRANALLSGRIDVTHDLLPETLERFRQDSRFGVKITPDARYIAFECRGPRSSQLKALLNSKIVRSRLANGPLARVAHDHPFPAANIPTGAPRFDGFEVSAISLSVAPGLGAIGARVVSALCEQLSEAGIKVRLAASAEEADVVAHRLPVRPLEDWAWLDWSHYAETGAYNLSDALAVARGTLDQNMREDLYMALAQEASEAANVFLPVYLSNSVVYARNLAHARTVGSDLDLDGARIAERWWRV